jgi:hypothetical protein
LHVQSFNSCQHSSISSPHPNMLLDSWAVSKICIKSILSFHKKNLRPTALFFHLVPYAQIHTQAHLGEAIDADSSTYHITTIHSQDIHSVSQWRPLFHPEISILFKDRRNLSSHSSLMLVTLDSSSLGHTIITRRKFYMCVSECWVIDTN